MYKFIQCVCQGNPRDGMSLSSRSIQSSRSDHLPIWLHFSFLLCFKRKHFAMISLLTFKCVYSAYRDFLDFSYSLISVFASQKQTTWQVWKSTQVFLKNKKEKNCINFNILLSSKVTESCGSVKSSDVIKSRVKMQIAVLRINLLDALEQVIPPLAILEAMSELPSEMSQSSF